MMKSPAVLVHPALDVTHLPVQHIHSCIHFPPISHWVITLLVSRHAAVGSLRLHSNNPYLMQRRPQHAPQCLRCAKGSREGALHFYMGLVGFITGMHMGRKTWNAYTAFESRWLFCFFFSGAEGQNQNAGLVQQALYHWTKSPHLSVAFDTIQSGTSTRILESRPCR